MKIGNRLLEKFVKVIPKDYKRMMESIEEQKQAGLTEEEAAMSAFETNVAQEEEIKTKNLEAMMQ